MGIQQRKMVLCCMKAAHNKPHTHSRVHEHAYTHVHSQEGMILFWVWEDYMPPGQL